MISFGDNLKDKHKALLDRDFPGWLPPTLVKYLRQGLRSGPFMIIFTVFPCALSLLFVLGFIEVNNEPLIPVELLNVFFWTILALLLIVVFPIRALSGIRDELQSRSIDFLILSKLTPFRIIRGKWYSHIAQLLLLVCMVLPFLFVRYYYGSQDVVNDLFAMLYLVLLSILAISMFIWASGLHGVSKITIAIVYFPIATSTVLSHLYLINERMSFVAKITFFSILTCHVAIVSICFLYLASHFCFTTSHNYRLLNLFLGGVLVIIQTIIYGVILSIMR